LIGFSPVRAAYTATAANNRFMAHTFTAEIRPYRRPFNITAIFSIVFPAYSI
jgi:hypothetical protein